MSSRSYFVTWSAQKTASTLPVREASETHFVLEDGSRVEDFSSTSYQTSFGHSERRIIDAIKKQLDWMPVASPKAAYPFKEQQTARLLKLLDLGGGRIFYTVSGAESVENALKMARDLTGRLVVAARKKSYHGASLGALSVTGDWRNAAHATVDEWTLRIPEPADDPEAERTRVIIEAFGPERIAAFCLETITAANGVLSASETWWKNIREICDEHGILLIMDEVACGFGRTGKSFAFQHYPSIRPDLVCMAKAISGGYVPFGAVWVSDSLASEYDDRVLAAGLTSYAHPIGIAAMSGVLDIMEDPGFQKSLRELEKRFASRLEKLRKHPHVTAVRVFGMFAGVNLRTNDLHKRAKSFIGEGLYLFAKEDLMVLAPALNMKPEILDGCMDRLTALIDRFAAEDESEK